MLKITPDAAMLLAEARSSAGAPDNFGVRIYLADKEGQQPEITFAFVPTPEPSDDLVTDEGLPVYVAPEVSEKVGEATLDAQQEEGSSQLVLRRGDGR